ncbi:response regulator transcription factor [Novispirillum sp. DQ9]|uniref:response regulator transcription factor n=1 Tax=Novispirillum sp. DQ9 TaxID=3398612 RepID=UPI003C7DE558
MTQIVHIVDDDGAVRDALAALLEVSGFTVETFDSALAFMHHCPPERAGCVVADLRMPGMDGATLQREMAARGYGMPIILISAHGDVATAVGALRNGAVDFLEKPFDDGVFLRRIEEALRRDARQREERAAAGRASTLLDQLSARERDVAALMIEGCANKIIAARLGISVRTVETHRARLLEKLGIRTVPELMRLWLLAERPAAGDDAPPYSS